MSISARRQLQTTYLIGLCAHLHITEYVLRKNEDENLQVHENCIVTKMANIFGYFQNIYTRKPNTM